MSTEQEEPTEAELTEMSGKELEAYAAQFTEVAEVAEHGPPEDLERRSHVLSVRVTAGELEVAVLDRGREGRKFRRLVGRRLEGLLPEEETATPADAEPGEADSAADASSTAAGESGQAESDQGEADRQAAAEDENLDLPEPGGDDGGDDTSGGS